MKQPQILNSKGEPIILNDLEQRLANMNQRKVNALGLEINITTLTTIVKRVTEQKFFHIAPADYVPVRVGEGAFSSNLVTYRSFSLGDDFATGVMNNGANNARLASADAGVDSLSIVVRNWAKSIGWNLFELEQAAKAGNWDLVTAKEKARKKNWDLGVQKVAFLGLTGDSSCLGLYTQAITPNTALIKTKISQMSPADLKQFVATVLDAYRTACNRTAFPTHFIVPESDYLGMAAPSNSDFPLKSVKEVLEDTFKTMTMNPGFKILPNAYGDAAYNAADLNKTRYMLLNYDEESIRMDLPVDYTNTLANSIDNFSLQNVGYGQFTGVLAYRPAELFYMDLTP